MAKYVYTMRRVSKTVPPQRTILKNISLNFFPGAKIGVLGLNGSGKSSLLKIMAGVDEATDGEVVRMPGIHVGYLPQEPALDAAKTVREQLDHRMLNEIAGLERPSLENLSVWIWERLAPRLSQLARVTVRRDSIGQSCTFTGPAGPSAG